MILEVKQGTRFTVKTNPDLGVLTVVKIGYLVDEFGDKTNVQALKAVDKHGATRALTPLNQFSSEYFDIV